MLFMFTYIFHQTLYSLKKSLSTFVLFFDCCPVCQRLPLLGLCSNGFLKQNIIFYSEQKYFLTSKKGLEIAKADRHLRG